MPLVRAVERAGGMKMNTYNPNTPHGEHREANCLGPVRAARTRRRGCGEHAYWSDFGWQAGDARPDAYVKFVEVALRRRGP
jgi:hypothetical protein